MPAHAPAVLVSPFLQPVVAEDLQIKIVHLERRVVDVAFWTFVEEEAMMVDELIATVEVEERRHVFSRRVMYELSKSQDQQI